LEAVANRGPFADLPTQLHQTITHRFESKGKHTPCAVENKPASLSNASPHPSTASIFPSNMSIPASNATENCGSGLLNTFAIPVAASHLTPGANGT
jgi:hypothetical protein